MTGPHYDDRAESCCLAKCIRVKLLSDSGIKAKLESKSYYEFAVRVQFSQEARELAENSESQANNTTMFFHPISDQELKEVCRY